ncbi:MAG: hypothetical protein KAH57_05130, partial [Thermoplasmata archaeon]|nr:hypothetical protein [Thermoplasmata archaeon]
MSGPVCPDCGVELADGEEVCSKCAEGKAVPEPEGAQIGDPGHGEGGEPMSSGEETAPEDDPEEEGTSDSEESMLKDLMEKVKNAQAELDNELGGGLEDLRKRVGGVVDVIDRLENMDTASPEEKEVEDVAQPHAEVPPEEK